jgi:HK97 family phage portal protein
MGLMRAITRGLAPAVSRGYAGTPSYGMIPPLGSVPSATGLLISQGTAMTVSTVYACVRTVAIDFARCKPQLKRKMEDGSEEIVTDHPLVSLLIKPNRVQSWFEFAEQMEAGLQLRGNAYAAIRRDTRGNPIEFIPINPDAVLVLESGDGSIFYQVNRIGLWQIAMLKDFPTAIPAEDVLHIRGLTFNSLVAASTIGLGRDSIGLAMGQEQQAARWMANAARKSGVLQAPDKLSDPAYERLKASWNDFQSGIQNIGKTAILEEGVKYEPLSLTSVDLEFLASRSFQVEDVCRWFRVPPYKVGVLQKTSAKSMPEQNQEYVNGTIAPEFERWESRFGFTFDLEAEGLFLDFDETDLLRADINTRYNNYRVGILSGFLTQNEPRRSEKLKPMQGADVLLMPANTASLGSDITGTAPDGNGRPPNGQLPSIAVPTSGDQIGAGANEAPAEE